jgi:hypothetical protein
MFQCSNRSWVLVIWYSDLFRIQIFEFAADALKRSGFMRSSVGVLCDLENYVSYSWDATIGTFCPVLLPNSFSQLLAHLS